VTKVKSKVWLAWSSGKDSAFALSELSKREDLEVAGLFTSVTAEFERVSMHSTRMTLLQQQAEALGLPLEIVLLPSPCSNEEYAKRMAKLLSKAKSAGISKMAFGDLYLDDVRAYRETMLAGTGLEPIFPLWKRPTRELANEMIRYGLKAVLTSVDPSKLDGAFVGREFGERLLADLPATVDPCGENGEFHTFVYAHPMFKFPIPIRRGAIVQRDGFFFADVIPEAG